jgi:GNAT superfamily N-acetyltransferase
VTDGVQIRPVASDDMAAVRDLFIRVNRLLAPPDMAEAFEGYIARSLSEEIDRLADYYGERDGGFWVADSGGRVAGMFGLEPSGDGAMELRRMYVDPGFRRRGIARAMLAFAEAECVRRGRPRLDLSTGEIQRDALRLYRAAGYVVVKEEVAAGQSNKTVGGGMRRYYFMKRLVG